MPEEPDPNFDPNSATIPLSGPRPTLSGGNVDLPLPEELAKLLPAGAYEVTGFLGAGGMGAVYKGMQIRLKRPVAIKIMRRDIGRDHDFEARFEREAQAMAKLNHPNIVSVIDYGEAGPDYLYIVMELVDGTDLMDVIRSKQMTQEMALTLLPQICDALQFAHDHGIVHRDIKPSNIMLTRDGRVKMADFGLAKTFDVAESSFRTQTGTGMGTPDYAAPEQFDPTTPVDHRADIYALGVMIYQMITGGLPRGVWRPPSQRAPVSTQWDAVVSRAMQNDPAERYQKASEVKTELSSIPLVSRSTDIPVRDQNQPPQSGANQNTNRNVRATSKSPLLLGLIGGAAVIAIGVFFALRGGDDGRAAGPLAAAKAPGLTTAAKSAAPSTAPPPVASSPAQTAKYAPTAAPALPESGWKPLFTDAEWRQSEPGKREFKDGLLHLQQDKLTKPQASADGSIRARIEIRASTSGPSVSARRSARDGNYRLGLGSDGKHVFLAHVPSVPLASFDILGRHFLPKPVAPGDKLVLELRVEGNRLTGLVNGAAVLAAQDDRLKAAGDWIVTADDAWFESVEVQPLPAAAGLKLWDTPEKLPKQKGVSWEKGAVRLVAPGNLAMHDLQTRDMIARASFLVGNDNNGGAAMMIRHRPGDAGYTVALLSDRAETAIELRHSIGTDTRKLAKWKLPRNHAPDEWIRIETRAIGSRISVLADGQVVGELDDSSITRAGGIQIGVARTGYFKDIEYVPLDAPAVSPSPSLPVSKSSAPKFPPGQWVKLFTKFEDLPADLRKSDSGVTWEDGWIRNSKGAPSTLPLPRSLVGNMAVRFHQQASWKDGKLAAAVYLKNGPTIDGPTDYMMQIDAGGTMQAFKGVGEKQKYLPISLRRLPPSLLALDEMDVEYAIVGDRIVTRAGGTELMMAKEAISKRAPGHLVLYTAIRDIEVINLDGLTEAEALRLLGVDEQGKDLRGKAGAAEAWIDVLRDPSLFTPSKGAEFTPEGIRLTGGSGAYGHPEKGPRGNVALRVRTTFGGARLQLRCRESGRSFYALTVEDEKAVVIQRFDKAANKSITLRSFTLNSPLKPGEDYEMELRCVGPLLTARLNGVVLGTVTDGTHTDGGCSLVAWETNQAPTLAKAFHVLDLSKPGASSVSPSPSLPASQSSAATATKDAPFTNTLGMKFVPVPGTSILMCIHETRKGDYRSYADENPSVNGAWRNPNRDGVPVSTADDHPVCSVNWEDAVAFCKWLSNKEGRSYRLPTDREWSMAVGLGGKEKPSLGPLELSDKIGQEYPWGTQWPPPKGAGNLGDAAMYAKFPSRTPIPGYDDGFATTAPVMLFAPNNLGIHDLAGNVWEYCVGPSALLLLRGGNWDDCGAGRNFLSSHRGFIKEDIRHDTRGFRCVVEVMQPLRSAPPSPVGTATNTTGKAAVPVSPAVGSSNSTPTKDALFINTLGMKFVPVPITGGQTNVQRVLFSVWETRVQDYEVFVKETKREWPHAEFPQGPTHPAVKVGWDDAMAFCAWLTDKERRAGSINSTEVYRLPSDHEWSCAAGIGELEDPTGSPQDKSNKMGVMRRYSWGSSWPPPPNGGNLGGEETREKTVFGDSQKFIPGYRDDFPYSAPVGTFLPTPSGLYDLNGNVWEWCQEPYNTHNQQRLIRGGGFDISDRNKEWAFLSYRQGANPDRRAPNLGFRIVLAPTNAAR